MGNYGKKQLHENKRVRFEFSHDFSAFFPITQAPTDDDKDNGGAVIGESGPKCTLGLECSLAEKQG